MTDNNLLKKAVDAVTEKPVPFSIDIEPRNGIHGWLQQAGRAPKKRHFVIKPLTLSQLQRISALLLDMDMGKITPDDILKLMQRGDRVAEIIAIAVTPSRQDVSKSLVRFFMQNLTREEMSKLLNIVLEQMQIMPFIISIASIRSLNLIETSPEVQAETIAPGVLSVAS